MLNAYPNAGRGGGPGSKSVKGAAWVDLVSPTEAEIQSVETAFGVRAPSEEEVSGIEASSRLARRGDVLIMTAPLVIPGSDVSIGLAPTAFILTREVLVTLRFQPIRTLEERQREAEGTPDLSAGVALAEILESLVDHAADRLEAASGDLDEASKVLFQADGGRSSPTRDLRRVRELMRQIGLSSDRMSKARYALVAQRRLAHFVVERGQDLLEPGLKERLNGVRDDIAALEGFEESLLGRVQLLQDAAGAFISIEQNEVVKVLTVASVAGIPPVLVVGVYGMNFKYMPELGWTWGYPLALGLIVVTTLAPILWFKWKDWI